MTLHEAIVKVLLQKGRTMSTQEIADELNKNGFYSKRNGSAITDFQIHGRTRKYSHLFNRDGSKVSLKSNTHAKVAPSPNRPVAQVASFANVAQVAPSPSRPIADVAQVPLNNLMNQKNFKPVSNIQNQIPNEPGLYAIRINDPNVLPEPFASHLQNLDHNILYIGIASKSLRQRIGQELWAEGHGTFFRGMGAVLGYRPPVGSLINKKNKKNYTFSLLDTSKIIQWININLLVNWVIFDGNFKNAETRLIQQYLPLMNTMKNPVKLPELPKLRKLCREIANTPL